MFNEMRGFAEMRTFTEHIVHEFVCRCGFFCACIRLYPCLHYILSECSSFRVWSVRYNHFHDQLLLSSSSDSRLILSNIVSLSSEPFGHLDDEDDDEDKQDR